MPHQFRCAALVTEVLELSRSHTLDERRGTLTVRNGRLVVALVANTLPQKVCFYNVARDFLNRSDAKGRAERSGVPAHLPLPVCGQDETFFLQLVPATKVSWVFAQKPIGAVCTSTGGLARL